MNLNQYLLSCPSCRKTVSSQEINQAECSECSARISKKQREYAAENPDIYTQDVLLPDGSRRKVIEITDYQEIEGRVIDIYGVWAVTSYGLESLFTGYFIEADKLSDSELIRNVLTKTWVNADDFQKALGKALKVHAVS